MIRFRNCVSFKLLFVWLLGVLVVMAVMALVVAPPSAKAPPPSLGTATSAAPALIKGTVMYGEGDVANRQVALTENQVLTVRLVEITEADTPAVVLGEQIVDTAGSPGPFVFEIRYDPAALEPDAIYGLDAHVTVGDTLLFQAITALATITPDAPVIIDVILASARP